MNSERRPALRQLRIADPPERWEDLGFTIREGAIPFAGLSLEFVSAPEQGIVSWSLEGVDPAPSIDGLLTEKAGASPNAQGVEHANGALGVDHVVVATPNFERTAQALDEAGMPLRRIRETRRGRQGFRRLGPVILELVEAPGDDGSGRARFWGLVVVVADLDKLAMRLCDHLGTIRAAVQPGRQIATLRESAGLSLAMAFMTPE